MGTISLTCPKCNKNLKMDDTMEQGFCQYCGNKIILKDNNTNIPNSIVSNESDFEIKDGVLIKYSGESDIVTVPNNVKEIGSYAFRDRTTLKEIKFSPNLKEIGEGAFDNCKSLKEIELPDELEKIGEGVFRNCVSLEKIFIPKSVKIIGKWTFSRCKSLKEIELPDELEKVCRLMFDSCASLKTIKLPLNLQEIEPYAFVDCISLKEIKLPSRLKEIGANAFSDCISLKVIELPNELEKIEKEAFKNCKLLEEIKFSPNLKEIGEKVFMGCTSLKVKPDELEKIGEEAFIGCNSKEKPKLWEPAFVKKIKMNISEDCVSLEKENIIKNMEYINLSSGNHTKEEYINNLEIIMDKNQINYNKFSGNTIDWTIKNWNALKKINVEFINKVSETAADDYELYKDFIDRQELLLEFCGNLKECENIDDLIYELKEKLMLSKTDEEKIELYQKYILKIGKSVFDKCENFKCVCEEYQKYITKKALKKHVELGRTGVYLSEYNKVNDIIIFDYYDFVNSTFELIEDGEIEKRSIDKTISILKLTYKATFNYTEEHMKLFNCFNEYVEFISKCSLSDGTLEEIAGRPRHINTNDFLINRKQKEDEIINPNLRYLRESQERLEKIREQENNAPKCPNCGSISIGKISNLNRAVSIGFFGLASSKIGKTMQCRSCGYKW